MARLFIVLALVIWHSTAMGQTIAGFSAFDVNKGEMFNLSEYRYSKAIVIIFNSNKCAYSDYYIDRIKSLIDEFNQQDVKFVMINSNKSSFVPEESNEGIKKYLEKHKLNIPYLSDKEKEVKSLLKATRTPEVVVLKPLLDRFQLKYQGAIDDNPQSASDVSHAYLRDTLLTLLSGNEIELNKTRPVGCLIK